MKDDMISRQAALNCVYGTSQNKIKGRIAELPSAQPDVPDTNVGDMISRQAALDALEKEKPTPFVNKDGSVDPFGVGRQNQWYRDGIAIMNLPHAQPFHNITMNDVLKYIDGMPEDVWQEFTACLECRGWELQRRTAKWCGGEFA